MSTQSLLLDTPFDKPLPHYDEDRLRAYLEQGQRDVNTLLDTYLPAGTLRLYEAMRYSLFAGGKRFRPILCLAAFETVQTSLPRERVLPFAGALELIHTYSLVHDDLPAMDNDDLRRGRPTSHKQYDEGTAILVGDALLTAAFSLMAEQAVASPQQNLSAIIEIAKSAGMDGMVLGQLMDLQAEQALTLTAEQLEAIHRHKTGALITASVRVGGIVGKALPSDVESLTVYGRHIGLAFQIMDDLLDVLGETSELGKPVGHDAKKWTYPRLMGTHKAQEQAYHEVISAITALEGFGASADPLRWIAGYTLRRRK